MRKYFDQKTYRKYRRNQIGASDLTAKPSNFTPSEIHNRILSAGKRFHLSLSDAELNLLSISGVEMLIRKTHSAV